MEPKAPEWFTTSLSCPVCGAKVLARLVCNGRYCGLRAEACCRNGFRWNEADRIRLELAASDDLFLQETEEGT